MKSLIIGIARTGSPHDFVLNPEHRYISMCGNKPEVSFSINCGQHRFLQMVNELRYDDADPSSSAEPVSFFQDLVTKIFEDIKYLQIDESDMTPLHIRLVTTPFELAQLPFEFVLSPPGISPGNKQPLLTHPERKITLTREVRQESEARYVWPAKPRILFAWAQPGGPKMKVPHGEHLAALKEIVEHKARPRAGRPDPEPFFEELLTELPNASLQAIKKAIADAGELPYTHIHILAHGGEKQVLGQTEFQLILCKDGKEDEPQKVSGSMLAKALATGNGEPTPAVVSLSVCDSGNVGSTILPSGSLVYQLHTSGTPCVFASQFPLTQQGSVTLVKTLFEQLINACDPRSALYETRIALRKEPTHDWASLVAYARFPEDIEEQLQDAKLKTLFGSMKVTNEWVDHVFKFWDRIDPPNKERALKELEKRLTRSIGDLSNLLDPANNRESTLANALLQSEHLGLMGSAWKREAEYQFRLIELYPGRKPELVGLSRESLSKAREFYSCGSEANPASHWCSMQYLSLKAVIEGSLKDENELWYITKRMAERSEKKAKEEVDKIWAWGTLSELYLLRPLTDTGEPLEEAIRSSMATSENYMAKIAGAGARYNSAKESTLRQFERYVSWWPQLFSSSYPPWLAENADRIKNMLPPLEKLLPVT